MNVFQRNIQRATGDAALHSRNLETIQVNLGLRCNLSCRHCHVAASPRRRESMAWPTMAAVLDLLAQVDCRLVDLTGGAPELNPFFREFVTALGERGVRVQVRTNLVVHLEPELAGMAAFLRDAGVGLVGSMPCYLEQNVDRQRGRGVHEQAILAIRLLNGLGYGVEPEHPLDLVYNPGGPFLPPDQGRLEADYRRELKNRFGLRFNRLLTIANVPIGRFQDDLRRQGEESAYLALLDTAFNAATLEGLMCRRQISVAWDGTLYDCDFNLALNRPVRVSGSPHLGDCDSERLAERPIVTGDHCLACTAGSGSSCAGALVA